MFSDIINELSRRGLKREAGFLQSIEKRANQIGRNQRLKMLLNGIFKQNGQIPYDDNGAIKLDESSDKWGRLDAAFRFFLEKNLDFTSSQAKSMSSDWANQAASVGRGYRGTREGMIDLLEDSFGGRAQAGSALDGSGQADQTPELVDSIERMRKVREQTDPLNSSLTDLLELEEGRSGRSESFKARREELSRMLRKQKQMFDMNDDLDLPHVPDESGAQTLEGSRAGIYMLGQWEQERSSDGVITGYKPANGHEMLREIHTQTVNMGGSMVQQDVHKSSPTFTLTLGPGLGEVVVGNIGHRPIPGNNWAKVN